MRGARAAITTGVAVASFAAVECARRIGDFDLPWNLASGRVIVESGGVPRVDALACTHAPLKYVETLADVALFATDRAGGPVALQVLGAATCAVLAMALLRATRAGGDAGRATTFLALASTATWLLVRGELFSFALLAVVLAAVEAHRTAPASRRARAALWSLVPLQAIWANVHGGAPLGALVAVAYAAHRVLASRASARWPGAFPPEDGARAGETALVAALATLATCASDAGPRLLLMTFRAGEDFTGVTNWARPTLDFFLVHEPLVVVVALVAVLQLVFARDPRTGSRALPAFDAALLVAAVLFATRTVRLAPVAAIVVAYVAGRRDASARIPTSWLRVAATALALVPAASVLLRTESRGLGFEPRHYPDGAVAWFDRARATGEAPEGCAWSFMPFGGWLEYRLYPRALVLMDGRNALARDPSLVALARESNWDPGALATLMRTYDVEWAVSDASPGTTMGAPFARDPAKWAMVHLDDVSAVYVRRDGVNAALAREGYRVLSHLTSPGDVLAAAVAHDGRAGAIAHDGALAAADDPGSARGAFFDACGAIATRDRDRFARAIDRVHALTSDDPALEVALRAAWAAATPTSAD